MIEVDEKGSPGWWLAKCAKKLEARQARLQLLHDRLEGNPPLPEGADSMRDAYRKFQKKSRTNFEEMIVNSRLERMKPVGFRTAVGDDENGDTLGRKIWDDNGLDIEFADVAELYLALGDSYMIVGGPDDETGSPIITGEDPRQVVTIHDPAQQRKVLAAAKFFHDDEADRDLAYLYLPGTPATDDEPMVAAQVWVAYRDVKRSATNRRIRFASKSWDWDEELTDELLHHRCPVVRFRRRRGVGVYENHVDILDRITHTVLNRMVIMAMQAFRQRAVKGNLPKHDDEGREIDYEGLFAADPGALWELPEGIDIWESTPTDLTPVLSAAGKDIELLSAVMKVPLSQFVPSAMPQSAEGASLAKEGLVFAVEDELARVSEGLRDVMSLAFLTVGDLERAERSKIEVICMPPERASLAERADAVSKIKDVVPTRTLRTDVLQFPPTAVARMEIEDAAERFAQLELIPAAE